ncbi:MAG TPA: hypothetical protein VFX43_08480 [Chitinophagaceae bacterium]|jgi:hypothetical protein|nr:hypothetical protein [Chitinophagaceae bacterium]
MKRTSLAIWTIVFGGCLLLCHDILSGKPLRTPYTSATYPTVSMKSTSVLRSPMNLLFPFESFSYNEVCRRPAFEFPLPETHFTGYGYSGLFFKTSTIGTGYIRLNEKLTFQKGNSFLLVPHALTLPVHPDMQQLPKPTLNLPAPD